MLLAIDIGNTSIKFGVFDGELLIDRFSVPTDRKASIDELRKALYPQIARIAIRGVIVCSVVPEIDGAVATLLREELRIEPIFVTSDLDLGLEIRYEPVSALGTDRLVNAFAAVEKYGAPCIVCSLGTALTIDVIDAGRVLLGGLIAPGMAPIARAINLTTSKLPEVAIAKPARVLQNTTRGAIQSGIAYGYLAMLEGLLTRVKSEIGSAPKTIATGGDAAFVAEITTAIDIVDETLLLDGLQMLHDQSDWKACCT